MRRCLVGVGVLTLLGLVSSAALAGNSDTVTVNLTISAINELNIDQDSVNLTINSATAGQQPNSATAGITYDITTNQTGKKIVGKIDQTMPANTELKLELEAPTEGTSAGAVTLTTTDADLVTDISKVAEADLDGTFTFSATVAAGTLATSRTCTLTLVDE